MEVECRSRVAKIGQTLLKPTEWKQVLKFALREAEISRLTVVKKLDPLTIYTFRARAGVKTTDLGDEWKVGYVGGGGGGISHFHFSSFFDFFTKYNRINT